MKYFNVYLITALLVIAPLVLLPSVSAAQQSVLQDKNIVVVYDQSLDSAAREIMRIYPELKLELEEFFEWGLGIRPQILLVGDTQAFQKITHNNLFVAFAVPEKNLIVIDFSRMNVQPFTLNITLKHELCHLMLHRHIPDRHLAKWIDEGVCQWVSDGIGEIFVNKGWSGLDAAVMAGRIIPLKRLTNYFPRDGESLVLAYEQSKSVIHYIDRQYGHSAIMQILDFLKNGETVETAILSNLAIPPEQLEAEWLDHLESTPRWLVFLASHLYAILFFVASVLTMLGFIRYLRRRKKIYEAWEEEDGQDEE